MMLLVDDHEVAPIEVATTSWQKTKGLLGRASLEGALYFPNVNSIHTFFMRFAIDVAFVDKDLEVVRVATVKPWSAVSMRGRTSGVVEAEAGAFLEWKLCVGTRLSIEP